MCMLRCPIDVFKQKQHSHKHRFTHLTQQNPSYATDNRNTTNPSDATDNRNTTNSSDATDNRNSNKTPESATMNQTESGANATGRLANNMHENAYMYLQQEHNKFIGRNRQQKHNKIHLTQPTTETHKIQLHPPGALGVRSEDVFMFSQMCTWTT